MDSAAVATETGATEIKVGLLVPQTGFTANYRPESRLGIDLALAELGFDSTVTPERVKKLIDKASGAKLAGESSPWVGGNA